MKNRGRTTLFLRNTRKSNPVEGEKIYTGEASTFIESNKFKEEQRPDLKKSLAKKNLFLFVCARHDVGLDFASFIIENKKLNCEREKEEAVIFLRCKLRVNFSRFD